MSESVFYVVAEDPEIEHIAPEMKETAVKEHGGEDGDNGMNRLGLLEGQQVMGDRTVMVDYVLFSWGREKPPEIEGSIQDYYPDRDKREDGGGIVILVRDQASSPRKARSFSFSFFSRQLDLDGIHG